MNDKLDTSGNEPLDIMAEIDREILNIGKKTAPALQRTNESLLFLADRLVNHAVDPGHSAFYQYEMYNEKLVRTLAADELAAQMFSEIDITQIYCSITGRPLGERNQECLGIAIDIHGMEKMRDYAWLFIQTSRAEHWIDTSLPALQMLQKLDPHGFFVFCANLLIQRKPPGDYAQHHKQKQASFDGLLVAQRIALFAALQEKPIEEVIQATNVMITILGFLSPTKLRESKGLLPYNSLVAFSYENNWRNLPKSLSNACAEVIKRHNPRIRTYTSEQLAQMQTQIGGIGFFRQMRISDFNNEQAYATAIMEAYGGFVISDLSLANWRANAAKQDLKPKNSKQAFAQDKHSGPVNVEGFTKLPTQTAPLAKPKLPTLPKKV